MNRDCWYMYSLCRGGGEMQRRIEDVKSIEPDQTIEILMTELDPQIMSIFTKDESANAKDATEVGHYDETITAGALIVTDFVISFRNSGLAFIRFYQEWSLTIICSSRAAIP